MTYARFLSAMHAQAYETRRAFSKCQPRVRAIAESCCTQSMCSFGKDNRDP